MVASVAVIHNPRIHGITDVRASVIAFWKEHGVAVHDTPGPETEMLITLGGDGTLLKAVRLVRGDRTLIYGMKFGRVGFLTNTVKDLTATLERILRRDFIVSERMACAVQVREQETVLLTDVCLNEALVSRAGIRIAGITAERNGTPFLKLRCDGLIIATPTGSTAHWFALGGPVIVPESAVFAVAPIGPYTLAVRPVVLPAADEITVRVDRDCTLVLDGQGEFPLKPAHTLVVRRHPVPVRLVLDSDTGFFQKMTEKFSWSA